MFKPRSSSYVLLALSAFLCMFAAGSACVCTEIWAPVCGANNVTYSNKCFANCEKVSIAHDGECVKVVEPQPRPATDCPACTKLCIRGMRCQCNECVPMEPQSPAPASGSCPDGRNPVNCLVSPCSVKACNCSTSQTCVDNYCGGCNCNCVDKPKCTAERDFCDPNADTCCSGYKCTIPVCAPNARCAPICAPISVPVEASPSPVEPVSPGSKCLFTTCPAEAAPVCGVDGKTYNNACLAECEGVKIAHNGTCETACPPCNKACMSGFRCQCNQCVPIAPASPACPPCSKLCKQGFRCQCNECVPMEPESPAPVSGSCPDGSNPVNCFVSPCSVKACNCSSSQTCVDNYCGGCNCDCVDKPTCVAKGDFCSVESDNCCPGYKCGFPDCPPNARCGTICKPIDGAMEEASPSPVEPARPSSTCLFTTCPAEADPVCGDDGKTYNNACLATCEGVNIIHTGECEKVKVCNKACTFIYAPVCGSDGKTYGNDCVASCAGITIVYQGECQPGCYGCPLRVDQAVCVSTVNGTKTARNSCYASCAAAGAPGQQYNGQCNSKCDSKCASSKAAPVCAYGKDYPNGVTYPNVCLARCLNGKNTVTVKSKSCPPSDEFSTSCPPGSAQAKCMDTCATATCPAMPTATCAINPCGPRYYRNTYLPNLCAPVFLDPAGNVANCCDCPSTYTPVCGRDNVTYPNSCVAQCRGTKVRSNGKCGAVQCTNGDALRTGRCRTATCAAVGEVCQIGTNQCCNEGTCWAGPITNPAQKYGTCYAKGSILPLGR